MTRLLNSSRAIIDMRKIENYCLDSAHLRGRHKARVFREALSIGQQDAEWLRDVLLEGIRRCEATELATNAWGASWRVDIPVVRHGKSAVVRSTWIIRTGEEAPRFVTCWVL